MVCYGCSIDLQGYQAYQSLYCSQCLNRRAVEKQTLLQAKIAERQFELQYEQMQQLEEQRDSVNHRMRPESSNRRVVPAYYYGKKILSQMTAAEVMEEYERSGVLPDPDYM